MKGGHNRLADDVKIAQGTFRPSRSRSPIKTTGLSRWPSAPKTFSDSEKAAWKRLGKALLPLGTVGEADLVMVGYLAQMMARLDQALADPTTKLTALNSLLAITGRLLRDFGLTPAARGSVSPLAQETTEEDALSEFV